jgi:hypothetical protein
MGKTQRQFPLQVSPASLLDVSSGYCQRALVDESGMIRKSDGDAQQIRNGCGARVTLCVNPTRIKIKNSSILHFLHDLFPL